MPRSWRACWVHSSATRAVIATSRSARERSPPVTSSALACIAAVLARWPASVTRSRWRESSTTSRRAASSRSTVRTCSGSAWRTAAVSTAGMPAASARASRWAACERHPGVPSGPPWWTTSTASPSRGQQRLPGREEVAGPLAAPGEHRPADVGVGAEQHEQPAPGSPPRLRATTRGFTGPGLREPCVSRTKSGVGVAGWVGPPGEQVGAGDRHAALAAQVGLGDQPAQRRPADAGGGAAPRPRASTVTRGRRGSTIAPPRTGVRERGRAAGAPASRPDRPVPPAGAAALTAPGTSGSTARSTPSTGAMPARPHAVANRTAP